MITKRTRALSIIAAVAMLVSMFACFVIPASAETEDPIAAVKAMYADVLANASADADGALAAALEAEYADADTAKTELAAIAGTSITLNEGIKPRYAYKAAYAAAGYTGDALSWSISEAEDWVQLTNDEYNTSNCSHNLYVTADIDFKDVENVKPLAYGGYFLGTLDGQGHVFKNLTITQNIEGGNANKSIGLISYAHNATVIKNLGIESGHIHGVKTSSTASGSSVGGILGASNGTAHVTNCWIGKDVTVQSDNTVVGNSGTFVGGIAGTGNSIIVEGCYSLGTVIGSANAGAIIGGTGAALTVKNSIAAANVQAPSMAGGILCHYYVFGTMTNNYSVGVRLYAPSNGTTNTNETGDALNQTNVVASVGEAAYKLNANANGEIYYTLKNGELAFGTATDRVHKIIFAGDVDVVYYLNNGSTITLADVADNATFSIEGVEIEGDTYTVPNADVTIDVDSASSVDLIAYAAAKAELEAIVSKLEVLNADLFSNGADMTAALNGAKDVLAADVAESTDVTKQAVIDEAAEADVVPALKSDAKVPYSKKALYAEYGASTTKFGIYEKEDWIQLTEDYKGKSTDGALELHVFNDIDFKDTPMIPLCYNGTSQAIFYGKIYGNGHTFKNINITGAPISHDYIGVGLISATMSGAAVDGLGLTGNITNTAAGTCAGVFVGARAYGSSFTNCWADVDLVAESTGSSGNAQAQYVGVFGSRRQGELNVTNCFFTGSITSKSGSVAWSSYGTTVHYTNTINAGTLVNNGGKAAMAFAHTNFFSGGSFNNTYSVGANIVEFTNGSDKTDGKQTFDSAADMQNYYNNTYSVSSVGEAAYKVNAAANGDVYYALKDGKLAFGTATDRVHKITFAGDVDVVYYLNNGSTITLADVAENATFSIEGVAIDGDTYTVPNADVTITVTYEKDGMLEELNELIAFYEKYDQELLDASSTVAAWLAAAEAAKVTDTYAAIKAQVIAAESIVIKLAADAKPAVRDFDLYAEYNTANKWSVGTEADWLKAVALGTNAKILSAELHLTNDIDFGVDCEAFAPLGYGGTFIGNIYGGGHVLKNVNVQASTVTGGNPIALISQMGGGGIITEIGITGTVNGDGSSDEHNSTGGLVGTVTKGAFKMIKCWNGATVTGDKATYASVGGLVGASADQAGLVFNGVYNIGTVTSQGTHGSAENYAGAIVGGGRSHGASFVNIFNAGTINKNGSSAGHAVMFRVYASDAGTKIVRNIASTNVVTMNYNATIPETTTYEETIVIADGYETGAIGYVLNSYYAADNFVDLVDRDGSPLEKIYFSFGEDGKLTFGTEATQIRKITFTGDIESVVYQNTGSTITLADVADNATFSIEGVEIEGDTYTVPNADVTINVESGSSVDLNAYAAAKAELEAIVSKLGAVDAAFFTNGADMTAAKEAAAAVLAADAAESTDVTKQAVIDEAAKADVVPALKSDAKVPYSKKAAYADYLASDNVTFGVYTEDDWIKMTEDHYGANCNLDIYVMNDIEFTKKMLPLCADRAGGFAGNLYGQGHTFKNVNIEHAGLGQYAAVGLIAACLYGNGSDRHVIDGLGLTGTITNNATNGAGSNYPHVGTFVGGKNYGYNITNCWADVELTTHYTNGGNGLYAGFVAKIDSDNGSIDNCFFRGTLTTLNGAVRLLPTAKHSNFINVGTLSGTAGTPLVASAAGTNSYSVGVPYMAEGDALASAAEAAWKTNTNWTSTVQAAQTYFFTVDANGELCFTKNANEVPYQIKFIGDAEATFYLKAGETITLADIHDDATFTIEGVAIDGATYTVSNADVTITVTDNNPPCQHNEGDYVHIEGTNTHKFVCGECGEDVGEAEPCTGLVWAEDTDAKTHSATCAECKFVYTEACVGTEKSDATDCTKDHWYEYECDRENETIVDSGADAHVYGEWTTEGATAGYQRHDCDNCDHYEEQVLEAWEGNANGDTDAEGNAKVDLIDAIIALRHAAGIDGVVINLALADMPDASGVKDGIVDQDDAVRIVRKWLKTV